MVSLNSTISSIIIVAGSPGTGKTTVAAQLAKAESRGLHLPADVFFTFPAHPISPYRPAAHEQNTDIMIALARTAATFAERGYAVFLDGIFGPWFLPVFANEVQEAGISVEYVVLRAPLETTLGRVLQREGSGKEHIVRKMHAEFSELGPYAQHAVDTSALSPEDIVVEVTRCRASGRFVLDLRQVLSKGAA